MPSMDVVSKLDMGEMKNAVNMAIKQINGRYDFKGSNTSVDFKNETEIELKAPDDYKIGAALDILRSCMIKRSISVKSLETSDVLPSGNQMFKQSLSLKSGIPKDKAKLINKIIKSSGLKLTSATLDDKVRITGKKIDDLQAALKILKDHDEMDIDLQMENPKS